VTVWVEESGVIFGPFDEEAIFLVEQSPAVEALGENLKKVEFMVSLATPNDQSKTVLVEAKSSIPKERDSFFVEIRDKMLHSLAWWGMTLAGKHPTISEELPTMLKEGDAIRGRIDLVLVIPLMPDEFLTGATDKFRSIMQGDARAWGIEIQNVRVLNRARAETYGVVQSE